jgi:hypothetical protein
MTIENISKIINDFRQEYKCESNQNKLIDPWFNTYTPYNKPVYKKMSIGYCITNDNKYEIVIKLFTRNKKTKRLALQFLQKVGGGRIERNTFAKAGCNFLKGSKSNQKDDLLSLGSSVSFKNSSYGTIGGFVKTKDDRIALLTCGHVLNSGLLNRKKVFSPAHKAGEKSNFKPTEIAIVHRSNPPQRNTTNNIDASTAILNETVNSSLNTIYFDCQFRGKKIELFNPSLGELRENIDVFKIGASKPFSIGKFEGVFNDVEIRGYKFEELYVVNNKVGEFAIPGDSGSIAFIEQSDKLLGLGIVIGRGIRIDSSKIFNYETYICPLNTIINELNVDYL